jgi:hypothetical protein
LKTRDRGEDFNSVSLKPLQRGSKRFRIVCPSMEVGIPMKGRPYRSHTQIRQTLEEFLHSLGIARSDVLNRVNEFLDPLLLFRIELGCMLVEVLRE